MDNLHTETRQIAARLRGARLTALKYICAPLLL